MSSKANMSWARTLLSSLLVLSPAALAQEVVDQIAVEGAVVDEIVPTATLEIPGVMVAATQPTAAGQIGVTPPEIYASIGVDLEYLTEVVPSSTSWIGVDPWFKEQPTGEPLPPPKDKGFKVAKNPETGAIEVSMSKWVHERILELFNTKVLAGCGGGGAKVRRQASCSLPEARPQRLLEEMLADPEMSTQLEVLADDMAAAAGGAGDGMVATWGTLEEVIALAAPIIGSDPRRIVVTGAAVVATFNVAGILVDHAVNPSTPFVWDRLWKFVATKAQNKPVSDFSSGTETGEGEGDKCPKPEDLVPCEEDTCGGSGESGFKCTTGTQKDCECIPEQVGEVYWLPALGWGEVEDIISQHDIGPQAFRPECDMKGAVTSLPQNVFRLSVYNKFCEEVNKNQGQALTWTVDSNGNQIPLLARRSRIDGRTPPPNPDAYRDYKVQLMWEPKERTDDCPVSCADAMKSIGFSPCGNNGGQANSMTQDIKYDVGCGKYSVFVEDPHLAPTPPPDDIRPLKLGEQKCNDAFDGHGEVKGEDVQNWARWLCVEKKNSLRMFNQDTTEDIHWDTWANDAHLRFQIKWIEGCKLDNPVNVAVGWPLGEQEGNTCVTLLVENHHTVDTHKDKPDHPGCPNNGGAGGYRDVGCLRYSFWVTAD